MSEGFFFVQWKGLTLRLFIPLQALSTVAAHNVWNTMMELPFHVQNGGILELFVEEIDLARIALSCSLCS